MLYLATIGKDWTEEKTYPQIKTEKIQQIRNEIE